MSTLEQSPHVLHLGPGIPPIAVLYCDREILALDKPAGMLAVPDRWDADRPCLIKLVHAAIEKPARWAVAMGLTYAANAHRIDHDTSGVFVLARTRAALASLVRQFRDRTVKKTYIAIVRGALPSSPLTIDQPIAPDTRKPGLAIVTARGRPSLSRAETVDTFRGLSLVRVRPETGRLHQVRVHLKAAGCPILCDADYGSPEPLLLSAFKKRYAESGAGERPLLARQALHAESIEVIHPTTGLPVRIESPLPRDMAVAVKQLGKYAR